MQTDLGVNFAAAQVKASNTTGKFQPIFFG